MSRLTPYLLLGLVIARCPAASGAQPDDTPDYLPGLAAELIADGKTHHRVDDDLAFDWGSASPDARIPAGPFRIRWTGLLFVNRDDRYRFSARLTGRIKMRLGDRPLLDGEARDGLLVSPPVELEFGYQSLSIEFKKTSDAARFSLFWEGKQFERERVPAWVLMREPSSKAYELAQRGEALVRAHRCAACHALSMTGSPPRAPSLRFLKGAISPEWLLDYLQHPESGKHGVRMPDFGLSAEEASAVAAHLIANSEAVDLAKPAQGNLANGKRLTERLGCLTCHTINNLGKDALFGGGDLSRIASKRPPGFFPLWLQEPARLNPRHRMPVFSLAKQEIADISAYLSGLGKMSEARPPGSGADGRKIIEAKRCANCHEIPGIKPAPARTWTAPSDLTGCLGEPDSVKNRPGYRFSWEDRRALTEFLSALPSEAVPVSEATAGLRLLTENNCLNCHARGTAAGLREVVAQLGVNEPKAQAVLVPPALHGVGDKLHPVWLANAVAGKAPQLRPWLAPRMPRFPLSADEVEKLTRALIAHDRLPERDTPKPVAAKQEELFAAAHQLIGTKGLGCTSCHAIGSSQPGETQPGTLGPDLRLVGERLRQTWFLRFLRDPARLNPGIEMPAIQLAAPGILSGNVQAQREALWHGLNAPSFTPPDAGAIQLLNARPDGPAIILRDLFEHGPGQTTVRPFAVALPNGHNVLIDLDTLSLRRWWIGDFARQKVRGKKWYWETAGVTLFDQPESPSLFSIKAPPAKSGETVGWLEWYEHTTDGVRLRFRVKRTASVASVLIDMTISPIEEGWIMRVQGEGAGLSLHRLKVGEGATVFQRTAREFGSFETVLELRSTVKPARSKASAAPLAPRKARVLPAMPGYDVIRLPLDDSPMPTALAWHNGKLLVASLKGGIYLAEDTDGDGLPDHYRLFGDYLSAPFGLLSEGADVLVSHRHELLRLKNDGRRAEVVATGWGVSADYHDWAVGPVRDNAGNCFLSLSCQEDDRPRAAGLGRGKILKIKPDGKWTEYAAGLRYAMGLVTNARGDLFATDNQGVVNPFNELNHIRPGRHYGFFNKGESNAGTPVTPPAIQIPHPWTRSVNGVAIIPEGFGPFAGQLVGADYTTRKLIRLSLQPVGDTYQGAAYPFSRDDVGLVARDETFLGPVAVTFGSDGCLYVGSLLDSGWGGGNNRGAIERVRYVGPVPFGIREVRAHTAGFTLDFTGPVDPRLGAAPDQYTLSCYRRIPRGGYETPDQDRTRVTVERVELSADRRSVKLFVKPLRPTFVYDLAIGSIHGGKVKPFPAVAYYTLNEVPKD
jgi:mono/diheme cytochrome c family protein